MTKETVSLAMCTCNGEAFLEKQLGSIRDQSFSPDELVVCDDASSDGTLRILNLFSETCSFPVRVFVNETNIGVCRNFEKAISHCYGDIILLTDQDDIWQPDKIETVVNTFRDHPGCGYVFSNATLVDEYDRDCGRDLWQSVGFDQRRFERFNVGEQVKEMLREGNFVYGMTMAFRAIHVPFLLPIESRLHTACTHDTWISLLLSAIGAYGVAISQPLVLYRQHGKQLAGGGQPFSLGKFLRLTRMDRSEINLALAEALDKIVARVQHMALTDAAARQAAKQLTEKATHLRARALVKATPGWLKIKIVMREAASGRYGQYSGSWKSILKDLLLG